MHRLLKACQTSVVVSFILLVFLSHYCDSVSIKHRHATYRKKYDKSLLYPKLPQKASCGKFCASSATLEAPLPTTTDVPGLLSLDEDHLFTTDASMTTVLPNTERVEATSAAPNASARSLISASGLSNFDALTKVLRQKRRECRKISGSEGRKTGPRTLTCEKLKLSSWLMDQLEKNSTELLKSYVQLIRNTNISDFEDEADLLPESAPERLVYRLISAIGEPVDKLIFYQFKKYTKSRSLQITIPHLVTLQLEPRTHPEGVTGRTLFDPGFNMKLKFPFFHDELKVAVATGPSFLAGLAVGLVVLGIKSLFAPFIIAIKAVILSWYFKDMSPMDLVKTMTYPMLPSWMVPRPSPESHFPGWHQPVENYEPPPTHNWNDHRGALNSQENARPTGLMGALTHLLPFSSNDQTPQLSSANSMFQGNPRPVTFGSTGGGGFRHSHYNGEGRTQPGRPEDPEGAGHGNEGEMIGQEEDSYKYVPPTAPQHAEETENLDPFYSPLLSRIDSIFMHLGFSEEGCKERAVCSVYKFPVKYAPYSNLLSAQLSKHQSELKRPVNTSPKVLRYFKYMKAAKDGQAALDCIELYPNCSKDTEKLTNLPMVKTFQQLTELMGPTGPTG